jgi:hypothetical protein
MKAGKLGGDPMLVIAIMAVLAITAIFALIVSSPLYRTLATALDSWAEVPATATRRQRY